MTKPYNMYNFVNCFYVIEQFGPSVLNRNIEISYIMTRFFWFRLVIGTNGIKEAFLNGEKINLLKYIKVKMILIEKFYLFSVTDIFFVKF